MQFVLERIITILINKYEIDQNKVSETANFKEDLGVDSLDFANLILELEQKFNIEIPDYDAERFVTINDIVFYIDDKMNELKEEEKEVVVQY